MEYDDFPQAEGELGDAAQLEEDMLVDVVAEGQSQGGQEESFGEDRGVEHAVHEPHEDGLVLHFQAEVHLFEEEVGFLLGDQAVLAF